MAKRKPNIPKETQEQIESTHGGEIWRLYTSGEKVFTPLSILEKYPAELIVFVQQEGVSFIEEFPQSKMIPQKTWKGWVAKYDFIREAVEEAKLILGFKRVKKAQRKEWDATTSLKDTHMYLPWWHKEVNVVHAELKNQETANTPPSVVYLTPTPQTTMETQAEKKERLGIERRAKANT